MLAHTSATAACAPPDNHLTGWGAACESLFAQTLQSAMKLCAGMYLSAQHLWPLHQDHVLCIARALHCHTGAASFRKLFVHICLPESAGGCLAYTNLRCRPDSHTQPTNLPHSACRPLVRANVQAWQLCIADLFWQ